MKIKSKVRRNILKSASYREALNNVLKEAEIKFNHNFKEVMAGCQDMEEAFELLKEELENTGI